MNSYQLKKYVLYPVLKEFGWYSKSAEVLMLGTAATESHCGEYIHQINGPALGIYQMEPATHDDLWNYLMREDVKQYGLWEHILDYCNFKKIPKSEDMISNLKYATIMARLQYVRRPEPLPDYDNLLAIGEYYKKFYNTSFGKGSAAKFKMDYDKYVKKYI